MAVEIKHKFQSSVPDGPNTGFVRPSNWNDTHNISMEGERLLGKPTAGAGDAVEIGLGAGLQFSSTNITVTFGSTAGTAAEGNHTHPEATTSVSGFLSALDKAKLDGLAAVASSGSYNDLTNRPTLGSAAALNVGTSAGTVAAGDDSRITGAIQTGSHAAVSVIGRSANSTGNAADIAASTNDRILARVSNALSWVQLTIGMIPDNLITYAKIASSAIGTTAGTLAAGDDIRFTTSPSNAQTANYTLVLSDAGKTVRMSNSSARTITIPPNSSVAFPVDTVVNFETVGTGACTIAAGSGVTLRSRNGLKLAGQYAVATAHKIGTNEWILAGDLTP